MARDIQFDSGVEELMLNGRGPLRFNPSDPNLYYRFHNVFGRIQELEKEYNQRVEALEEAEVDDKGFAKSSEVLNIMKEMDGRVKALLSEVFGEDNDFDNLLDGINIMAFGSNGERVVTNLLNALLPIIQAGTKKYRADAAAEAVAQAKQKRAQRGVGK